MKNDNEIEQLKPYIESAQQMCPDLEVSTEFILVLRWFIANTENKIDIIVYDTLQFLRKIQPYIDAASREAPDIEFDIDMLDIFECVAGNLKSEEIAYGLQVAKIMQKNINGLKALHPDRLVDENCLNLFCYLAHTQPELTDQSANLEIELIQQKIEIYLKAAYLPKLNIAKIKYLLWVAANYSHLPPAKAMQWVDSMVSSKRYRQVGQVFPPSYPFSFIGFKSNIDGRATFEIYAKTCLNSPHLYSLLKTPNSRKGYLGKGVIVDFNLHESDTPQGLVNTVAELMDEIEITLVPQEASGQLFHDSKWKILRAARNFCAAYAENFPGLIFEQMHPPKIGKVKESDAIGKKMRELIDQLNYPELARMLATGLNANHRQWGISMLEQIADLPSYTIYLLAGELAPKHAADLYKSYDYKKKYASNPHKVVIGKQSSGYFVHWCMENNGCKFIMSQPITTLADRQFLDTLTNP